MGDTQENLQEAFAGESQASCRYLSFADKAEKEGRTQVARLFRATADAETVHARSHFAAMGSVGETKDNLGAAIKGEEYEFTQMYPGFIKQAESDGKRRAQMSFEFANEVEKVHHELYQKALETLEAFGLDVPVLDEACLEPCLQRPVDELLVSFLLPLLEVVLQLLVLPLQGLYLVAEIRDSSLQRLLLRHQRLQLALKLCYLLFHLDFLLFFFGFRVYALGTLGPVQFGP